MPAVLWVFGITMRRKRTWWRKCRRSLFAPNKLGENKVRVAQRTSHKQRLASHHTYPSTRHIVGTTPTTPACHQHAKPDFSLACNQPTQVCECLGLAWGETIPQQFNNVAVALLTLFEISTTEAWTSVTYAAVDSTSEDMQPIRDYVLPRVWFFILFMLVGAYLVLNLFVGVVVDNFKKVR